MWCGLCTGRRKKYGLCSGTSACWPADTGPAQGGGSRAEERKPSRHANDLNPVGVMTDRSGWFRRRWLWWGATPALLLTGGMLFAGSASAPEFLPLQMIAKELIEADDSERLYSLQFTDPDGNSVDAYLREPVRAEGAKEREALPAIVLAAGRFAGRQAAAMIPGPVEVVMLAVEYPQTFPPRLNAREWFQALPAIRRSARRMPGILRGAAYHLAENPTVDAGRIVLVGVSFGVPFATIAGKDPIFSGVALHYGGANLASLFRANLQVENRWLRGALATFAGWWFRELEPARHVANISPTPLLLINATDDDQIPRESALRLAQQARSPVHQIWLPYGHLTSGQPEVIREVADSTFQHFRFHSN